MANFKKDSLELFEFLKTLKKKPPVEAIRKTPDGRALYLPIGYIKFMLDHIFMGLWNTKNFRTQVIGNEIVGTIDLVYYHPVLCEWITRTGSASIVIMVDALNDEDKIRLTKREKNAHALDVGNKKPNALETGYPKLLSNCLKNAAATIGPVFGRNINYKPEVVTTSEHFLPQTYTPKLDHTIVIDTSATREDVISAISEAKDIQTLTAIFAKYDAQFDIKKELTAQKNLILTPLNAPKS